MQLFGSKGQKFLHCPGTKGQRNNLAMGRDRPGQARTACQNLGRDSGPRAWDPGPWARDLERDAGPNAGRDNYYFFPENGISVKYFCPGIKGQRDVKRETLVYMQSFSIFL